MAIYRLRAGFRDRDGIIGAQELDEMLEASDVYSAVVQVRQRPGENIPEGANMIWLTDAAGNLLWSQRTTDDV